MAWRALRHPNVLQLLGVTVIENRFVMVSEWMVKGNIDEFVKADTEADRLGLVCFLFLIQGPFLRVSLTITWLLQLGDVTRGLIYMHDQGTIHGNLNGVRF